MIRRDREPPAPTPLDEALSAASLESSPWIKRRIKELGIVGKKVRAWSLPAYSTRMQNGKPHVARV
jgi:hypothetical protein